MVIYDTGAGDGALESTDGFSFFVNGALISLLVRVTLGAFNAGTRTPC